MIVGEALAVAKHRLEPGGASSVQETCADLLLVTRIPKSEIVTLEGMQSFFLSQRDAYIEHLGDIPADVLKAAAKAHVRTPEHGKWFPTVQDLLAQCDAELAKRKRDLKRVEAIAANNDKPKAPPKPAFVRESREDRLRGMIRVYRKWPERYFDKAVACEHELATLEGRDVEAWTLERALDLEPPREPALVVGFKRPSIIVDALMPSTPHELSAEARAALNRSLAREHRSRGGAAYADRLEREADALDPDSRMIPEGHAPGDL